MHVNNLLPLRPNLPLNKWIPNVSSYLRRPRQILPRKKRAPSYANDDFWPEYLKEKPGPVKDGGERTHSSYPYADSSAERSFDLVKSSSNVIQVFVGSIFSAFATCSRLVWSLSNALGGSIIVIFIITSSIGAFIPSDIRSHVPRPCARLLCLLARALCIVQRLLLLDLSVDCKAAAEHNHSLWGGPLLGQEVFRTCPAVEPPPTAPADLSPPLGALNHTETDADYALANDGAYVIKALTSPTAGLRPLSLLEKVAAVARGYDKSQIHINPPSIVLEDGLDSGCWKFEGSQGHVALSLTSPILWQGFGLHFPKKRSLTDETIRQAPKDILLWALVLKAEVEERNIGDLVGWEHFVVLNRLVDSKQFNATVAFLPVANLTFNMLATRRFWQIQSPVKTSAVLVEVLDNWGDYATCLRGLSIYGTTV